MLETATEWEWQGLASSLELKSTVQTQQTNIEVEGSGERKNECGLVRLGPPGRHV